MMSGMKCLLIFECVDSYEVDRIYGAVPRIGERLDLTEDDGTGGVVELRVRDVVWTDESPEAPTILCDLESREWDTEDAPPRFKGDRHPR